MDHSHQHHILFCEPYSVDIKLPVSSSGSKFTVSDALYKTMRKAPKKYIRAGVSGGNAYVFGKKYPLSTYKLIGSHGNDGAQTGFIDLDILKEFKRHNSKHAPKVNISECFLNAFKKPSGSYKSWDDRASLKKVQKELPYIIFLGDTFGGDVGASLYGHFTRGKLDSIIVDVWYFWLPNADF